MSGDFSIVEGNYLQDILDQPRALENTVAGLEVPGNLQKLSARLQEGAFQSSEGFWSWVFAFWPLADACHR